MKCAAQVCQMSVSKLYVPFRLRSSSLAGKDKTKLTLQVSVCVCVYVDAFLAAGFTGLHSRAEKNDSQATFFWRP